MLDCLFIGSATKDTLLMVEAPPASDQRIAASAVVHACGGVASVAASAFQKLGGSAGLITVVGDPSDVTDFIASNIAERQLPYVDLIRVPGTDSPFSTIQVEASGKRCITHFGGCIRQLTLDMLDKNVLADAKMIHRLLQAEYRRPGFCGRRQPLPRGHGSNAALCGCVYPG